MLLAHTLCLTKPAVTSLILSSVAVYRQTASSFYTAWIAHIGMQSIHQTMPLHT